MIRPGNRDSGSKNFVMSSDLMSEHSGSHLPDLDYRKLACARLSAIAAKGPTGRFESLVAYLAERSQGATAVDAAELDRRLRTWFEDLITRILAEPEEWDQEMILNGKTLMDFLAGTKAPEPPAPPAAQGGQSA